IITDALNPVPKFEGHVPMKPKVSFHINFVPLLSAAAFNASDNAQKRANTERISPPSSIEMIRQWSSSFTQANAVWVSLWKIPRLFGHDLAAPAPVNKLRAVGIWNKKPRSNKNLVSASDNPPSS
ncbi:hypothetical protein LTR94_033646, partial [Friedmanniomyces endolithicus]